MSKGTDMQMDPHVIILGPEINAPINDHHKGKMCLPLLQRGNLYWSIHWVSFLGFVDGHIEALFAFGDSYVDTGNFDKGEGTLVWAKPYGSSWPSYGDGRFGNGHVQTDYICKSSKHHRHKILNYLNIYLVIHLCKQCCNCVLCYHLIGNDIICLCFDISQPNYLDYNLRCPSNNWLGTIVLGASILLLEVLVWPTPQENRLWMSKSMNLRRLWMLVCYHKSIPKTQLLWSLLLWMIILHIPAKYRYKSYIPDWMWILYHYKCFVVTLICAIDILMWQNSICNRQYQHLWILLWTRLLGTYSASTNSVSRTSS